MLHRLLAASIVVFWLAMTGLLIQRELYPESTGLNAVAVSYVGQLFFQHHQPSDLHVHASGEEIGFIHIQALPDPQPDKHELAIDGNISIPLPNGKSQRLAWYGKFQLTSRFNLERFNLNISGQDPGQHVDVFVDRFCKTAEFAVTIGSQVDRTKITLDKEGFGSLFGQIGMDPTLLHHIQSADTALPEIDFSAQVSSVILSGEKISTYLLTIKAGGQTVIEAHVSQLGQVLKARAPLLGYKLASYKETP